MTAIEPYFRVKVNIFGRNTRLYLWFFFSSFHQTRINTYKNRDTPAYKTPNFKGRRSKYWINCIFMIKSLVTALRNGFSKAVHQRYLVSGVIRFCQQKLTARHGTLLQTWTIPLFCSRNKNPCNNNTFTATNHCRWKSSWR